MKSGVSSLLKRKKALMSWQHPIAAAAAGLDGSQYSNPVLRENRIYLLE